MKSYLWGLFLFFQTTFLFSQQSLEGNVTDAENQAIAFANLSIPELKMATVTDEKGRFSFLNLPNGSFVLLVTAEGFKPRIESVKIPTESKLSLQMQAVWSDLPEVTVLGQSYRKPTENTLPISTIQSNQAYVEEKVTLTDALADLPGVSVFSNGPGISKPVIRGLTGQRIALVNNGFAVNQQQWQNEHGMQLFSPGVEQVQVIKGAASVLFGEGAMGGAVQLIPEKEAPVGKTLGDIRTSIFSNTIGLNTEIGLKGSTQKVGWIVRAAGQSHGDYYYGSGKRAPNTRFGAYILNGTLNLHRNKSLTSFHYQFLNTTSGIIEARELLIPEKESRLEREYEGPHHTINQQTFQLNNAFFTGKGKLHLNFNVQLNDRKEVEGNEEGSEEIGNLGVKSNTFIEQLLYQANLTENYEVTIGAEAKQQSFGNHKERILIPDASLNTLSGYMVHQLNLNKVQLNIGLRMDRKNISTKSMGDPDSLNSYQAFDRDFTQWNGNMGASFSLSQHWQLKLNVGLGSRVANLAELASNGIHEGTSRYEIGNPDLKAEQNSQYDLAVIAHYPKVSMEFSLYYNRVQDFIFLERSNESYLQYTKYFFVQEDATLKGLDLAFGWNATKRIKLNHSFSATIGEKEKGGYLPFIPAFNLLNGISLSVGKKGRFSLSSINLTSRYFFEQDRTASEELPTADYFLIDAGIHTTWQMGKKEVKWSIQAQNLFNKTYFNHLSFIRPLGVANMGRTISVSAKIPLGLHSMPSN